MCACLSNASTEVSCAPSVPCARSIPQLGASSSGRVFGWRISSRSTLLMPSASVAISRVIHPRLRAA